MPSGVPPRGTTPSVRSPWRGAAPLALALGMTAPALAHTPITTRYRFYEDVLPVLQRHCLRCHSPDGPTPMSLASYEQTRPWAESIKEQVLARNMPPVFLEHGGVRVRNGSPLTARELDVLVDWASGGAPEGTPPGKTASGASIDETGPPTGTDPPETPPSSDVEWKDLPEFRGFLRASDRDKKELQKSHRVRWSRTSYLTGWSLESDPEWLRSAVLWIEDAPAGGVARRSAETDILLGSWVVGDEPFLFPRDAALELDPGSAIRIDARYRRTWRQRSPQPEPRTRLRVRLAERPPPRRVISVGIRCDSGKDQVVAAAVAFFPSAPGAGELRLESGASGGPSRVLLDVYRVSKEWPVMYRFTTKEPLLGRLVWVPRNEGAGSFLGYALYVTDR